MSDWIRWSQDVAPDDRALVGGKALELSTLARLGLPVPPSFAVTTQALTDFVSPVAGQPPDALRAYLATESLPPGLQQALATALNALCQSAGDPDRLIARSSATFEDAPDFSAAGQLASVVSAPEPAALEAAVRACWLALTREPLLSYLRLADREAEPGLAVVVQPLIETDVGGVLFTRGAGPEYARDAVVIEAGWGMSHGVTGELVSPTRLVVDRETHAVLDERRPIGPPLRTMIGADGEARVVPAPTLTGPPLSPLQIEQLVDAAQRLEAHYGAAQDVEWGFRGDQLILLQSRPVTVGAGRAGDFFTTQGGDQSVTWVTGFFEERFPHPLSPLTWTYLFPVIEQVALREPLHFVGVRGLDRLPIMRLHHGRAYANMAVYQMLYKFFPGGLLPTDAYRFFPGGDVSARRAAPEPTLPRLALAVLRTLLTEGRWHPLNYRVWERFLPGYHQALARIEGALAGEFATSSSEAALDDLRALTADLLRIHRWSLNYAEVLSALLRRLVARWTNLGPERVVALLAGADSPTMRADRGLRALAEQAAARGAAPDALPGDDPALTALLDAFLAEFGHRSFCLDLRCARSADDPAAVWDAVRALLQAGGERAAAPPARGDERHALRAALDQALRQGANRWLPYRRWLLRAVWPLARRYVELREVQRFEWQRALHLTRRVFKWLEARWLAETVLRRPDDVFFLTWDEVRALLRGEVSDRAALAARVAGRRRDFRRVEHAPYPRFLRGEPPLTAGEARTSGAVLQGMGASAGQAVGTARVIMEPRSLAALLAAVADTDVLVTRATDPGWTPVFGRARAVVMSLGGQLSHGAIVAREYGIPAVVGLGDAVARIEDGARILVDGDAGTVHLLPKSQEGGDNLPPEANIPQFA